MLARGDHTANPIESSFATVRRRTKRSKNCLSRKTAMAMVFKLIIAAEKRLRGVDAATENRLTDIPDFRQFGGGQPSASGQLEQGPHGGGHVFIGGKAFIVSNTPLSRHR